MSNIRAAEIYIQRKTYRRLYWVAAATGQVTDKVADDLLNEALESKYPQLLPAEEKLRAAQAEFTRAFGEVQQSDGTAATLD